MRAEYPWIEIKSLVIYIMSNLHLINKIDLAKTAYKQHQSGSISENVFKS